MTDTTLFWLVLLGIIGIVVTILAIVSRRSREWLKPKEDEKSEKHVSWLSHFHSIWWMAGAGLGALKYIYQAYQAAPLGSAAKLGWGALLALIAAIALFAIVRLIDNKLNPPLTGDEIEAQRDEAPTTYTHGQITDQWEYKR